MPGRRPYRMGKRAAAVAETRRRILDAATAAYAENGIEGTSMQAVARRADLAPGTVLYHYPTPDDLAEAVVADWEERLEMPTPALIDPEADRPARIAVLVEALFGLYQRSEWAYQIYRRSPNHPALAEAQQDWEQNVGAMIRAAMGSTGAETMAVVSVLVDPGFRGTLIARGLAPDRAVTVAIDLVLAHLERAGSEGVAFPGR